MQGINNLKEKNCMQNNKRFVMASSGRDIYKVVSGS
jgi:hypothetical protein